MHKRSLRAPFVATFVTTVSALAGCGGVVKDDMHHEVGHNPPSPIPACPDTVPADQSACDGDRHCTYDFVQHSPDCATSTNAQCVNGKWFVSQDHCEPPGPVCPAMEPIEGASCVGALDCSYPDRCRPENTTSVDRFVCENGFWQLRIDAYAVKCPATAPSNGDACVCAHHLPASCGYDLCQGTPSTTAKCDARTNQWIVARSSCNPPGPMDAGTD